MTEFCDRLKAVRLARGITAEQMAVEIGVTRDMVMKLESGKRGRSYSRLPKIAKALGCRIDDLFPEMDGNPVKDKPLLEMDWEKAFNYLNMMMAEYVLIGAAGWMGLQLGLVPLRKRYDKGERTPDLYDSIMAIE